MKQFDLNIEKILENWETFHAIREVISNALDEQLLTNTQEISITKDKDKWIIRDFGRGIRYTNLTQNENQEKLANSSVIGKFGIGLKDALATFDRKGILVLIKSKYGDITLSKTAKQDFADIITLHANIDEPTEPNITGTKFIISGATDEDIQLAKNLFLKFSGEHILESTKYGQVIGKKSQIGNIYISGVKVAEEPNFLFSYNITEKTKAIQKALNRERTNVGRSAYSDSIKKILLGCTSATVAKELASDLQNYNEGLQHDELSWIDVQEHSVKILSQNEKAIFVTSADLILHRDLIDQAKSSGHSIIVIPESLKSKISGSTDLAGNKIIDISQFANIYNDSFEFAFVDPNKLSKNEKTIYDITPAIIKLIGGLPKKVRDIKISETMVKEFFSTGETLGCWDPKTNNIVVSRKQLGALSDYSGTLIHEIIHAQTGFLDISREFETELTKAIGIVTQSYFNDQGKKKSWF